MDALANDDSCTNRISSVYRDDRRGHCFQVRQILTEMIKICCWRAYHHYAQWYCYRDQVYRRCSMFNGHTHRRTRRVQIVGYYYYNHIISLHDSYFRMFEYITFNISMSLFENIACNSTNLHNYIVRQTCLGCVLWLGIKVYIYVYLCAGLLAYTITQHIIAHYDSLRSGPSYMY